MLSIKVTTSRRLPCAKATCYQLIRRLAAAQADTKKKEEQREIIIDYKTVLPAPLPKKPARPPFAKNFFLGKFDYEFLAYPEPQHVDRYNEFEEWMKPLKEYMKNVNPKEFETSNSIPSHVLQSLRDLNIFGARIATDYRGMNLLDSEFMQILDTVGKVPALGLFVLKQGLGPIDLFQKYGNVEQKLKYLPRIAKGQSVASIGITEHESGPGATKLDTVAILSDCGNYWQLDGEKTFVANAKQADVFIIFGHAMAGGALEKRPETLASFIVEKETEGLNVNREFTETLGLKGYTTGRFTMKNVKIPKANILGKIGDGPEQLVELFTNSRHVNAALSISILKNLHDLLVQDILHRQHFDKMLYDTYTASNVIINLISSIYTMESVLYMTTSMIDIYDKQDVQLETALTEQYCVQECMNRMQECMWLVGSRSCTLVQPYEQILRDAFTVANFETSLHDTKIYSALLGLQHYGLSMGEKIKKLRNPLMFPWYALQKTLEPHRGLHLHIEDYLHPSLQEYASVCDRCLFKLKDCAENMLLRNGTQVTEYHVDLQKLSDMAAVIYAYVSSMARASRSYCIGNRDSENEVKLNQILAYRLDQRVKQLAEDINVSEFTNGDYLGKELSDLTFERKHYYAAHPLQRNY